MRVAPNCRRTPSYSRALVVARCDSGPGTEVRGCGKLLHVAPALGQNRCSGCLPDTGDRLQKLPLLFQPRVSNKARNFPVELLYFPLEEYHMPERIADQDTMRVPHLMPLQRRLQFADLLTRAPLRQLGDLEVGRLSLQQCLQHQLPG